MPSRPREALEGWGDDLENAGKGGQPKNAGQAGSEPRLGKIQCKPAPDAQDRLRRLFTLLFRHETGHLPPESADNPASGGPAARNRGEEEN